MNRILEVDLDSGRVTVEPGVTNLAVTQAVAPHGFYYAPDPSSQQVCTIGGNVAENSGGAHCLKHGFTVNHVTGLEVVLPDGELVHLGGKGLDPPGRTCSASFVGSEGTLGIATRITLRDTAPAGGRPHAARRLRLDERGRRRGLGGDRRRNPRGRDGDHGPAHARGRRGRRPRRVTRTSGPILIVELDGDVGPGRGRPRRASRRSAANCGASEIRVAADDAERALIWKGRKAAFAAMGRVSPDYYVQDGVVPRTRLPEVLERIAELEREYGLRVGNVFHAGDGNLHPLVLYDRRNRGRAGARRRSWPRRSSTSASTPAARSPASTASASTKRAGCR